jgi:hypothetical protein
MLPRFFIWLSCGVLFAYLPCGVAFLYDQWHPTHVLADLFQKGDLMLISSAITADGFGRIILQLRSKEDKPTDFTIVMLVFSLMEIVGCLSIYAASQGAMAEAQLKLQIITLAMILLTTVASGIVTLFIETV